MPNTDTLHALIREYRDARKIPLNVEHRLMLGMAPDYENLTVIQKVEVFEHALESTSGMALTFFGMLFCLTSERFHLQCLECEDSGWRAYLKSLQSLTLVLVQLPDDKQPNATAHYPAL